MSFGLAAAELAAGHQDCMSEEQRRATFRGNAEQSHRLD